MTPGIIQGFLGCARDDTGGTEAPTRRISLEMMISQGFRGCKGGFFIKKVSKPAYFVPEVLKRAQNKAFQEKKYLTEGTEWLY